MTRETKVGAVVAISFLSLVGVVVVSKWRNQAEGPDLAQNAPAPEATASASPDPNPARPKTVEPKGPIENAQFIQPVPVADLPNKLPGAEESNNTPLPMLPQLDPSALVPVPLTEDEKLKKLNEQIAKQNTLPPLPGNPGNNVANQIDNALNNVAAKIDQAKQKTANAVNQGAAAVANGVDDFFTRANDKLNKDAAKLEKQASDRINQGMNQVDKNLAKANDKINGAVQVANDKTNKAANKTEQQLEDLLKQGNAELNKGVEKLNNALPPLPPPPAAVNNGLPPVPAPASNTNMPPLPAPIEIKPPQPAPTGGNNKLPGLPGPGPMNAGVPAPLPAPVGSNAVPAPIGNNGLPPITNANTNPETPRPMIPAPGPIGNNPPGNNPPGNNPLANNLPAPPVIDAKTSFPPIPAPSSPQVRDSETVKYPVKGGETLEAIAKAQYGSEKYAKAVLAYNRDFAPAGKLLSPALQPGQTVLLPSKDYLEDRYAAAIGASAVAPISINTPMPAVPPIPAPNSATAAAGKTYRVPAQGQFLFEISIRTLGDGNRWSEIYRLNPNINPQQPIPGGTELKLPANAK